MSVSHAAAEPRSFRVLHRDGATAMSARIPRNLTVGTALPEIAVAAGYPAEPGVSTRYALLAAPGGGGDYMLVPDNLTFGQINEDSVLLLAPQPRPA